MRYYYILSVLLLLSSYVFSQQNESKYDVAAYIWPAYQDDPRFKEMNVFPDGKGEWERSIKLNRNLRDIDNPGFLCGDIWIEAESEGSGESNRYGSGIWC